MRRRLLLLCLTLISGFSFAQTIQLTNGGSTTLSGATGGAPISAYFEYMRFQVVYTAAELNAAGVTGPKAITQLGWYVSTAPSNALPSYKIRMANTAATNSAAHNTAALTEVYSNAAYTAVAGGFDMLTLNGSFVWDGTSNVLVDVCFGPAVYASPYGEVRTYAASTTSGSRRIRCDACGSQCAATTNTANTFKPQVSLTFAAPPSCLAPGSITATPGTTTAALSWGAVTGASGYEYAVTTSATPPASGTATATNSASASSLTPATAYYAHVRTACGASFSSWSTTAFTTLCTAGSIPYSQNFDGVTAPALPSCIIVENVNASNTWGNLSTPAAFIIGAPNSMVYAYNSTVAADDWFYLQGLNLTAGVSYRLTFKWKSNPSFPERFEVKYGTAANAASMTTGTLYTNTNAASSTVITEAIDFIPSSSGTFFIGFHCNSIADQDFLAIDDVTVDLSPACGAPTALTATPTGTATTADLAWTAPGIGVPTGYEWAVTTSATPPGTGTATAGTTATATGLTPGTTYYLHVRTNCGAGGFSNWATVSFVAFLNDAPCGAIALTLGGPADCGNTTLATSSGDPAFSCSSPNNTVWYKYTPATTGTVNVRMAQNGGPSGQLNAWVQFYSVTGTCPSLTLTEMNPSACTGQTDLTTVAADTVTSPVLTAGVTYYILIDGFSGASGAYCINLIAPPPPPACVTNVSPANGATGVVLTGGAAAITWNAAAGATSYDVYFGTVNPPTANIGNVLAPAVTVNITGLAYDTTYYWYVVPRNTGGPAVGCNTNTTSFTVQSTPPNCIPLTTTGCASSDRITLFRLKGEASELNINTGSACNTAAYVDTTDHPVVIDLARGKSYWGQAQAGTTGDYLTLWLDANDNGLFENSERLMNNLPMANAAPGNINLFIPLTTALGNHTLRARLVYYGTAPTTPTNPCGSYTYTETEDYRVNITAGGTPYTVSTYTPSGTCYTDAGQITVDAASNNNSNYVPLVDSSNALIAQLYPQGNNLGRVTTSYYKHNGAVRQDAGGRYYLDRNLTITVATQPTTPYNLRFPYQNSELNALIAQPGSGVTSQFDLVMTKNGDACLNLIGTGGTGGLVFFPTGFGSISGDRFVDVTNITGGFSSFYLHSGSTPIPVNLVKFEVQRNGRINQATWSTSQEVNTSHFVVERSNDGRNFTAIGQVTANGNSNALLTYSFTDNSPARGINYYRLRVVDTDNTGKYSQVRSVRNEGLADVAIFPNPVNDVMTVSITADKAERGEMTIADISGKIIYTRTLNVAQGDNKLPVNVSNMASGAYIIKVQLNDDIVIRKFNKL